MKPLIYMYGTPENVEKDAFRNYLTALEAAGAEVLHTSDPDDAARCCGLMLPGGGDVDPAYFGQESRGSHPPDPLRDKVELWLVKEFLLTERPIFGVCRGEQVLNIALGGTLLQDIPGHTCVEGADRLHSAEVVERSALAVLYGTDEVVVNSAHHQVIDRLGEGLHAAMYSADGYVEAVEHDTLAVLAVQWHPERLAGALARPGTVDGQKLFDRFVQWCAGPAEKEKL